MTEPPFDSPDEWLEELGRLAERDGRITRYVVAFFSLWSEHGLPREKALAQALEGIADDLRSEVIETIEQMEEVFPGRSPELFLEMQKTLQEIGLDDENGLEPIDEINESG